jgi:hypothetical protein
MPPDAPAAVRRTSGGARFCSKHGAPNDEDVTTKPSDSRVGTRGANPDLSQPRAAVQAIGPTGTSPILIVEGEQFSNSSEPNSPDLHAQPFIVGGKTAEKLAVVPDLQRSPRGHPSADAILGRRDSGEAPPEIPLASVGLTLGRGDCPRRSTSDREDRKQPAPKQAQPHLSLLPIPSGGIPGRSLQPTSEPMS